MISSFPLKRSFNPGGYSSFKFIPVNEVVTDAQIRASIAVTPVVLRLLNEFYTGYSTAESLELIEKTERTDDGTVVSVQINGFTPGEKDELINLLYEMERFRFIVILMDSHGRKRLVGSKANPLLFKSDFNSGARRADGKGMSFSFYGQAKQKAPVYPDVFTYYSQPISESITRNNCAVGYNGSQVIYSILAGAYTSQISQDAANAIAQLYFDTNKQAYANLNGICTLQITYSSVVKSGLATRNNCVAEENGSEVNYIVAAGSYTSIVSQPDADNQAQADVDANKQSNANAAGTCTPATIYSNSQRGQSFTRNNCGAGYTGSLVGYVVLAGTYTSLVSQLDADDQAYADVVSNGQNYANANGTCTAPPVQVNLSVVIDSYTDTLREAIYHTEDRGVQVHMHVSAPLQQNCMIHVTLEQSVSPSALQTLTGSVNLGAGLADDYPTIVYFARDTDVEVWVGEPVITGITFDYTGPETITIV